MARLRFLLRRLGPKSLITLALVAGYPAGQYSLISYAVNSSLPALAGDFGVAFAAEEWSYHPLALKAVARKVTVRPRHDATGPPIFTAAEIEFEGSVFSSLRGLKEALSLQTFHTFNEITIRHGRIQLERSRTGRLNWTEYQEAMPEQRRRELMAGLYQIHAVRLDDVALAYVEHLHGDSGGGVIQTVQAAVYVDGIHGVITDIGSAPPGAGLPTRVRLAARSADGTIDIDGRVALRGDQERAMGDGMVPQQASTQAPRAGGPAYDIVVDLNNIGAAAFARSLPSTRIMATAGSVHGRIKLRDAAPGCESE